MAILSQNPNFQLISQNISDVCICTHQLKKALEFIGEEPAYILFDLDDFSLEVDRLCDEVTQAHLSHIKKVIISEKLSLKDLSSIQVEVKADDFMRSPTRSSDLEFLLNSDRAHSEQGTLTQLKSTVTQFLSRNLKSTGVLENIHHKKIQNIFDQTFKSKEDNMTSKKNSDGLDFNMPEGEDELSFYFTGSKSQVAAETSRKDIQTMATQTGSMGFDLDLDVGSDGGEGLQNLGTQKTIVLTKVDLGSIEKSGAIKLDNVELKDDMKTQVTSLMTEDKTGEFAMDGVELGGNEFALNEQEQELPEIESRQSAKSDSAPLAFESLPEIPESEIDFSKEFEFTNNSIPKKETASIGMNDFEVVTQVNLNINDDMAKTEKEDHTFEGLDLDTQEIETDEKFISQSPLTKPEKKISDEGTFNVQVPMSAEKIERENISGLSGHYQDELLRLQATLRQLRLDREDLISKNKELLKDLKGLEQENTSYRAELDEVKIELNIVKKRHQTEMESVKNQLVLAEEKKMFAEEKLKRLLRDREKNEQKLRVDINQIRQREKELENKLELLAIDTDAQVQSREQKIIELRRKLDALEFNMENSSAREQKTQEEKAKLEEKLNKIIGTLRSSIKVIEEDSVEDILEFKKKMR